MKNFDLTKELYEVLKRKEKESINNIYFLRPETINKIYELGNSLKKTEWDIEFDGATNSIVICLQDYVFDSCVCDLKSVFRIVDLFVIDAVDDGQVCIEMKILNAANIIGGGI